MAKSNINHGKLNYKKRSNLIAYCVVIPVLIYHFTLIILPSLNTLYSALTKWNGIGKKEFIGLSNFKELFNDPNFMNALTNNLKWMAIFLTLPIILGFLVGYLLTRVKRGRIVYRAMYFLPYVISAAIAGKIFAAFYNPYFGINVIFKNLNLDFLVRDWLAPNNALVSVALVDNWHWWGFVLVIFMSALQQIDPALYEVAEVEGATTLEKMRYVTIPSIKNTIIFIIVTTMVWSMGTFEYVWVMTKGGPGSELLSTMLYKNSLFKYRAGYASAIAVVQVSVSFIIFGLFALIRRKSED
ncbi:sugar-binding protein [Vallitalea longa]|uniref:Sugar-binding protein n=1 Tax=Vallitalea longa TaxID=2936439 RepID=A0A9W5Y9B8_9FIRM|nr:sugar ABC transporter permease [Vallitalea longa]GKX28415.1 sugar-binding protein [Vallitalea longa]